VGHAKDPVPVRLIVSAFAASDELIARAREQLVAEWGPLDYESELLPFAHTPYYAAEFGTGLVRRILAFERLIDPAALAPIKGRTNEIEQRHTVDGHRSVNLDAGYVALSKIVLATTKNYDHRIYLGEGIYAEVTLHYRKGAYHPWPWTYPDYATPEYCALFAEIRGRYLAQLRQGV